MSTFAKILRARMKSARVDRQGRLVLQMELGDALASMVLGEPTCDGQVLMLRALKPTTYQPRKQRRTK